MSKKSKIIISLFSLITIFLVAGLIIFNKSINKSLIDKKIYGQSEEIQMAFKKYEPVGCKFSLFNPEYAFVSHQHYIYPENNVDMESCDVDFFTLSRPHIFSSNWQIEYTGGTTIKNTTFPELVAMVKDDCSQFQDGHASDVEGGPEWIYTRAQTTEEKAHDIRRGFLDDENRFPLFKEIYGDVKEMTDEEVLALSKRIDEEGLDKQVEVRIKATAIRNKIYRFTDEQTDKLRKHYGEWKDFADEELIEWGKQIVSDYDEGKFDL